MRIEFVSCAECGRVDVSYSPDETFEPWCWYCRRTVDTIIRTVDK